MKSLIVVVLLIVVALCSPITNAESFDGKWVIDIRTAEEIQNNTECGMAIFDLTQNSENIIGTHEFYSPGCGRINEGGSVVGKANGLKAILFVTSGRNGAVVKGSALLKNGHLYWKVLKDVRAGDFKGDSPLILNKGVLNREKSLPTQ